MDGAASTLLICTVGGSPQPIAAALTQWRPLRVRFVHTPQTRKTVEQSVQEAAGQGFDLDPGRYDLLELPDGEDLASCVDKLRELSPEVERWVSRGAGFQAVVDLTGGTKCMSAAIATHASRWTCLISYVGGGQRTKDGVGVVVSGHEDVRSTVNPWDTLGYQAVEDFVVLFDQRAFVAAARVAERAKTRVTRSDRKREFAMLERLAKGFDDWERFDHKSSGTAFNDVVRGANDLRAILGPVRGDLLLSAVTRAATHLDLCETAPPSRHHVLDLLANASRRRAEGRFDDAVARLYRAIEAVAQVTLKDRHSIGSTEKIPLDLVPETLRTEWASRANEAENVVAVALQDAYRLLAGLNDPLGEQFESAGLNGEKSPLVARNQSILAHGFVRVSGAVVDKLWQAALFLADIEEASLPSFPRLGAPA